MFELRQRQHVGHALPDGRVTARRPADLPKPAGDLRQSGWLSRRGCARGRRNGKDEDQRSPHDSPFNTSELTVKNEILARGDPDQDLSSSGWIAKLDELLWRLFHQEDEVRTLAATKLSRGCRCDPAYVRSVIARFPDDERDAMVGDDGLIRVDCAFCSSSFAIQPDELKS